VAWAKEGIKLVIENPLGFGLIEGSFGRLVARQWPGTSLTQSHSGWVDLALGIGIPGMILILGAFLTLMIRLSSHRESLPNPIQECMWWVLMAMLLLWSTSEISQKVYFESLIFWLSLAAGLSLKSTKLRVQTP